MDQLAKAASSYPGKALLFIIMAVIAYLALRSYLTAPQRERPASITKAIRSLIICVELVGAEFIRILYFGFSILTLVLQLVSIIALFGATWKLAKKGPEVIHALARAVFVSVIVVGCLVVLAVNVADLATTHVGAIVGLLIALLVAVLLSVASRNVGDSLRTPLKEAESMDPARKGRSRTWDLSDDI